MEDRCRTIYALCRRFIKEAKPQHVYHIVQGIKFVRLDLNAMQDVSNYVNVSMMYDDLDIYAKWIKCSRYFLIDMLGFLDILEEYLKETFGNSLFLPFPISRAALLERSISEYIKTVINDNKEMITRKYGERVFNNTLFTIPKHINEYMYGRTKTFDLLNIH